MENTVNKYSRYDASSALRKVVLRMYQYNFPGFDDTTKLLDQVEGHIQHCVRGLISTLGLGLDAAKNMTYTMTENGVMKDEVQKCYLFRFPVKPGDETALIKAITDDLFKYAGDPAMVMASARLVAQGGELVVIGMETHRDPNRTRPPRAKVNSLRAVEFFPE